MQAHRRARFLALVSFLTSGHFVPNSGRGLLTGRLVNLRRAACAGLRRFLLFPPQTPQPALSGDGPGAFSAYRLRRFLSGAVVEASLPSLSAAWMSERLITLPDGAGVSSPMPGRTVCCVCLSADGGSGST